MNLQRVMDCDIMHTITILHRCKIKTLHIFCAILMCLDVYAYVYPDRNLYSKLFFPISDCEVCLSFGVFIVFVSLYSGTH